MRTLAPEKLGSDVTRQSGRAASPWHWARVAQGKLLVLQEGLGLFHGLGWGLVCSWGPKSPVACIVCGVAVVEVLERAKLRLTDEEITSFLTPLASALPRQAF